MLLLSEYLVLQGYEVFELPAGADMWAWLSANDCDVVLLDIMLPAMNGLEEIPRSRELSPRAMR